MDFCLTCGVVGLHGGQMPTYAPTLAWMGVGGGGGALLQ